MTRADIESQEIIADGLAAAFPGIPIVGEEGGLDEDPGHGLRWYVDPIDGTDAFIEGLAHWGPTIGLVDGAQPILGALYLPRLEEWWFAALGQGAWRDDRRLTAPQKRAPSFRDVLYVPSRFHRAPLKSWPGKVRALGTTAVHLAQVASGAGRAAIVGRYAPWDVACGLLLVAEAGRVITDLSANPLTPLQDLTAAPFFAGDANAVSFLAELVRSSPEP